MLIGLTIKKKIENKIPWAKAIGYWEVAKDKVFISFVN
jgi:hypothetical protein